MDKMTNNKRIAQNTIVLYIHGYCIIIHVPYSPSDFGGGRFWDI